MPPLAPADQRRLVQFVGMAGSQHDGEALAALRKAQQLCAAYKLTLIEAIQTTAASELDFRRIQQLEQTAFERGRAAAGRESV